ncbi:MAG TPA: hypothetical protein VGM37_19915 [Armatimonadota bacterium]|jgi:hypothetical protein
MALQFACPACGQALSAPDAAAGQTGSCPFCGARITAPARAGEAAALPQAAPVAAGMGAPNVGAGPAPTSVYPSAPSGGYAPVAPPAAPAVDPLGPGLGSTYSVPPPAAVPAASANVALIAIMWTLTALYWGSRFVAPSVTMALWLPNLGALYIASSLRRSRNGTDQTMGNARWVFGIVMVIISVTFRLSFGI